MAKLTTRFPWPYKSVEGFWINFRVTTVQKIVNQSIVRYIKEGKRYCRIQETEEPDQIHAVLWPLDI